MKIFITGGTGFVGSHFVEDLLRSKHTVTVLTRSKRSSSREGLTFITGDPNESGNWQDSLADHDVVINLAGTSIFGRWSGERKKRILQSRVETTTHIVEAVMKDAHRVSVLINASAVGFYGNDPHREVDESDKAGDDFLARVAVQWEEEAMKASAGGIRVVCCRFGVVLGPDGGALAQMVPAFRLGLGSKLGSGRQWFPWIHIDDLTRIVRFVMDRGEISGPVNCTSPQQVTNAQFTKSFAKALHRPLFLPQVPSFVLKLALGEASEVLLGGQQVKPDVLRSHGFEFKHEELDRALADIVGKM